MKRLSGKVAVVTGGNAGIGEAIAKVFAREGASVVITGRRQELYRQDIVKEQGKVFAVVGSVTDESYAQEVYVRRQQFGRLDILINTGVGDFGRRLHEIDDNMGACP
jgi:NAD(P)-dependent dehydrogenase (short-subunit alcohol dehydrogenase family)